MTGLAGRVALVTGAARGIGLGIAQCLANAGARLAVNDLQAVPADALNGLDGAIDAPGDVSDEEGAEAIVRTVLDRFGRIDILVNNAGISGGRGGFRHLAMDDWQRVLDVNLRGTYLMSRAVAQAMRAQGGGRIINIASVAGLAGFPGAHAYGASKAGVVMLTRTMALELAKWGITVNCIAPGVIAAPMLREMSDDGQRDGEILSRIPLGMLGASEDIGHAAMFFASPGARYVTGTTLPVDGGWTCFGGFGPASHAPAPS